MSDQKVVVTGLAGLLDAGSALLGFRPVESAVVFALEGSRVAFAARASLDGAEEVVGQLLEVMSELPVSSVLICLVSEDVREAVSLAGQFLRLVEAAVPLEVVATDGECGWRVVKGELVGEGFVMEGDLADSLGAAASREDAVGELCDPLSASEQDEAHEWLLRYVGSYEGAPEGFQLARARLLGGKEVLSGAEAVELGVLMRLPVVAVAVADWVMESEMPELWRRRLGAVWRWAGGGVSADAGEGVLFAAGLAAWRSGAGAVGVEAVRLLGELGSPLAVELARLLRVPPRLGL